MIEANDNLLILDVRTPEEYENGHIEGAINIPHDTVLNQLEQIDISKNVLVYCGIGKRSAYASDILSKEGYNIYNMYEGYNKYMGEN
ncbi:MAG: rhodanese-like domain-containing protein [Clostridiales bacterium]|nr:rhodanese-like domain-containing protein [Clostridiales bacterium]